MAAVTPPHLQDCPEMFTFKTVAEAFLFVGLFYFILFSFLHLLQRPLNVVLIVWQLSSPFDFAVISVCRTYSQIIRGCNESSSCVQYKQNQLSSSYCEKKRNRNKQVSLTVKHQVSEMTEADIKTTGWPLFQQQTSLYSCM